MSLKRLRNSSSKFINKSRFLIKINNKSLVNIIARKSRLILAGDVYLARYVPNTRKAKKLFARAAPLEEKIGDELALRGRLFDASINWLSAGTCYGIAEQRKNSILAYNKIINAAVEHPGIIPEKTIREARKYTN